MPERKIDHTEVTRELRVIAEETGDHEFFNSGEAADLIEIGINLARYLHDTQIKRIVFLDSSARLAYLCLREAWHRLYPEEEIPEIYFVNPNGFNTEQRLLNETVFYRGEEVPLIIMMTAKEIGKNSEDEDEETIQRVYDTLLAAFTGRDMEKILKELKTGFKRLTSDRVSPLMLFDTCVHSGSSILPIREALKAYGFIDIEIGLASEERNRSGIKPDFVALDEGAAGMCYPFDTESMIKKEYDSLISSRSKNAADQERGRQLRRTITSIFDKLWDRVT